MRFNGMTLKYGTLLILLHLWFSTMSFASPETDKIQVLILSGQNNHDWKTTTPVFKQILEKTGSFSVDVVTDPEKLTTERLANYDVLLSNWNGFGSKKPLPWSDALKSAYVEFVRKGGGHVVMHAGSSSFYDWDDYQAICGATWKDGTGHKDIHEFEVRISDDSHPITRGLKNFKTTDELWFRPHVQPGATVIAESFSKTTGKWEPTALVSQFGKGRCFTLLLGHDAKTMQSDGFKSLLIKGTEWASAEQDGIQETENTISMRMNGKEIWTLHHNPEEGKPYIHPLATTTGQVFSALRPKDHVWHRALWFSWKYINGVNYWEEDPATGKSKGQTLLLSTKRGVSPDNEVRVDMTLAYAPAGETAHIMREKRSLVISPPDEAGAYTIDWTSEFCALENDVVLDRTPLPGQPNGKDYGGYAGYSVRMNKQVSGGTFLNSEGLTGSESHRQPARWAMYSAPEGGCLLFMDHPDNLRYPAKWYVAENMPYFSPSVIHDAPHTIKAGESFHLRYRLRVHPTAIGAETAQMEWSDWATPGK